MNRRSIMLLQIPFVCMLSIGSCVAIAQSKTAASSKESGALEEIVVTAQKRAESAQSVPITISAFSSAQLKMQGIDSTTDLVTVVPGFKFNETSGAGTPYLRGVGYNTATAGNESPVATYLDGVYIPNMNANFLSLYDVKQVSVIAGPQGTLFGRNASGGVIQIVTRNPERKPSMDINVGYGNYDTLEESVFATRSLIKNLAISVMLHQKNQENGWGRNLTLHNDNIYRGKDSEAHGKLLWTPGENTEFILSGFYSHRVTNIGATYGILPGALGLDGHSTYVGFYNTTEDRQPFADNRYRLYSLTAKQDLGWAKLTSITAYQKLIGNALAEGDGSATPWIAIPFTSKEVTITQEMNLRSSGDSRIKWIVGAFYMRDRADLGLQLIGKSVSNSIYVTTNGHGLTRSLAGYAQATAGLTRRLNLTLGIRYTQDRRGIWGNLSIIPLGQAPGSVTPINTPSKSKTWSENTYRAALDYHVTDEVMLYAEYDRGFKAGLFNLQTPQRPTPTNPEILDAYEGGLKSQFLNNTVRLNASAFYYDYKGTQVKASTGGVSHLFNANSRIKGIDVSLQARPIENLYLTCAFELLDPKYTYFPNALISAPAVDANGNRTGGNIITVGNVAGNTMIQASKYSGSVAATYLIPSGSDEFALNANLAFYGKEYWDFANRLSSPAYQLLNASLEWMSPDDKYDVRVWGKNLTSEHYYLVEVGTQVEGDLYSPAAPLTFGVTLGAHF